MSMGPIILANVGVAAGLYIGVTAPNVFVEIIGVAIAIGAVACGYAWGESQKEVRRLLVLYQQHQRDYERLLEMWRRERGEIAPSEDVEPNDQQ
jgi:hypothetical protein